MIQSHATFITMGLLSTMFLSIALFLIIQLYIQMRFRFALYLIFMTLCPLIWIILSILSIAISNPDIEILAIAMIIPMGFAFIAFFDSLHRDSIDARKFGYLIAFASIFILSSLIEIFGDELNILTARGLETVYFIRYVSWNFYAAPLGFLWIIYLWRILLKAPPELKRYARISFIGSLLVGLVNPLLVISQIGYTEGLHMFAFSLGVFLSFLCWVLQPRLAYVLPFKALRLLVVDTVSGLPLFSHVWNQEGESEEIELVSTVIQAVTVIIDETIQKGNISKISLERAVIIVKRIEGTHIACLLISTRSSQALRYSLDAFANAFYWTYSDHLQNPGETNNFSEASLLVNSHFSFVPEYS